ncbi:MAG: integrin alpha, partial [Verrucomicrobiota bacterium]
MSIPIRPGSKLQGSNRSIIEPLETRIAPATLANLDLASLDGTNGGFKLNGGSPNGGAGYSVSEAGDVNGDGYDDVIIGAPGAAGYSGESYLIFGRKSGFPAELELEALDGTSGGFKINGGASGDELGISVSTAGDFNADGFDDLIVGAWNANAGGVIKSGQSYLIFGQASGFGTVDVSKLDGTNGGFKIDGASLGDQSGTSVSAAGDFNGDGYGDLVVGAFKTDLEGKQGRGQSYLIFGKESGFGTVELSK